MALKIGIKHLLDEANRVVEAISPTDAHALLEDTNQVFINIRDVQELDREGLTPKAYHAPRGMLEFWVDPDSKYHKSVFSQGKDLILYCNSGWRSALAAKTLMDMGLEGIQHLQGGFSAWREAALPIAAYQGLRLNQRGGK